jgi:molybdate transport system substrate-binding protein
VRPSRVDAAVAALTLLLAACSGGSPRQDGELLVFAAASLQRPFTEIGAEFEQAHPGTRVVFNFAGSSNLLAQLQQGARADVFAAADTATMDRATADSLTAGTPVVFASNTLQIAVPPGNPAGVRSLEDLAGVGVKVVVCAPAVPCGAATARVESASGVHLEPVSEEQSVTDVLGKVTTGEADAGLVYVTDVKTAGDAVRGIEFPESSAAVNAYPISVLEGTRHASLAEAFMATVTDGPGQRVLAAAGFAKAP